MKRVLALSILIFATALAQAPNLGGRTLRVATDATYPPFESIDTSTNQIVGFDVDLFNAICGLVNCQAEYISTAWDGIFVALQAGEYDAVMGGASITEERENVMDFTDPYLTQNMSIVIRSENEGWTLEAFLANSELKVGTVTGTTNADWAKENLPRERVALYDTFPATALALSNGDIDGIVIDNTAANGLVQANAGQIIVGIKDITDGDPLGFVFQEGSDLVDAFNYGLTKMRANGSLQALITKWFTQE